ncbi:MAG: glycosyltransferase [Steroidobacteraceae bacterium]
MRLLYITREEFPTHRVDVSVLFAELLAGKGHTIDFVMQAGAPVEKSSIVLWERSTVFVGPSSATEGFGRWRKLWLAFRHELHCLREASRDRYDAVQVRDKFVMATIALAFAQRRGQKFFFWLSFPYPEDDQLRSRDARGGMRLFLKFRGLLSAWLLYRVILPRCDHAFVQSAQMLRDLEGRGARAERMTPVPMAVRTREIATGLAAKVPDRFRPVIGYLGTLNHARHLEDLVDMLALLHARGCRAQLLLIGDGDSPADRKIIVARAAALGVQEHVVITGFMPRDAALERLREAHVCISPIYPAPMFRPGSPTKLIEYMAQGYPVIANDHPEQQAILRASRAGVCTPWGARHFARGILWLLNCSAERREAMARAGQEWVRGNRTYEQIVDRLEQKYLALLDVRRLP